MNYISKAWRVPLLAGLAFLSCSCHKNLPVAPIAAALPPASVPAPALPPTVTLIANPTTITAGEPVTLQWQTTRATSVSLDNSIGAVDLNGTRQIRPQTSATYVALAKGPGGTASSPAVRVTVNVVPPPSRGAAPAAPRPPATPNVAELFQNLMKDVLFDYDKSQLRPDGAQQLETGAQWLLKNPSIKFTIDGNADERGGQEYNIALGDDRASTVKKFLVSRGVPETRIETVSYGEEKPICRDQSETCWQRNRRAHFTMRN